VLWKQFLMPLYIVMTVLASYSFGEEDDVDVTDKYVAEHKDQFRVERRSAKEASSLHLLSLS